MTEVTNTLGAIKTACIALASESSNGAGECTTKDPATTFGVTLPGKIKGVDVVGANGAAVTITAEVQEIDASVNGQSLILTSDASLNKWTWSASAGMPAKYIPKN